MGGNGDAGFEVLISSDSHVMEPSEILAERAPQSYKDQVPRFPKLEVGSSFQTHPGGSDPSHRIKEMETDGLSAEVLYPTYLLPHFAMDDAKLQAVSFRAYNDWLIDYCRTSPKRLIGIAAISVYDIDDAVSETRRVAEEYNFRSVFLRSNIINGINWYDPHYEPLWNLLEELNLPLGFHEASASRSRQAAEHFEPNFGLRRVYAQPFEQMMGMGAFLGGGILERHPKMRVAFLEANCSWLPWLLWRLDEGYEREGDVFMPDLVMKPSEYFKRQCWISIEPDEAPARYTIEEFGCDQLVFSTDYPHGDSKYPHAVESFLESKLSEENKRKILWDNCARFYGAAEYEPRKIATDHDHQQVQQ